MFVLGLCLSLIFALSKAFPVEYYYPSGLQSNDLYDLDGYNTEPYAYHVPANPHFVYDTNEGRWIPKCNGFPSSHYPVQENKPPRINPLNANHRRRANRRQGFLRSGHSATFDAFRGAIAFG
ncbi:uncharacterized protein LOC119084346 [Bradysia coprophila]|uniref:uncharacterized protein LOC119084346 n=1 Tax=Bradysia coprophila TaxID=38358 RepID=UPI00187DC7BE|nr:uncharacterized protein LOC119084346 [Bradysia coprophila]